MACEFICDGCGKRQSVKRYPGGWFKPHNWFERTDKDTGETSVACSRECVEKVNQETGKNTPILPI